MEEREQQEGEGRADEIIGSSLWDKEGDGEFYFLFSCRKCLWSWRVLYPSPPNPEN